MNVDRFNRALKLQFANFQQKLRACKSSFGNANIDELKQHAKELFEAGQTLRGTLDKPDYPPWLDTLTEASGRFFRGTDDPHAFLNVLMNVSHMVKDIDYSPTADKAFNFDQMFEQLKAQGNLQKVFDDLINAVQQILDTGEIRDIYAIEALNRLLATLKANRDGSLLAMRRAFNWAVFGKSLVIESVKKIGLLDIVATAYENALEAGQKELDEIEDKLHQESVRVLLSEKAAQVIEESNRLRLANKHHKQADPAESIEDAEFEVKPDSSGLSPDSNQPAKPTEN